MATNQLRLAHTFILHYPLYTTSCTLGQFTQSFNRAADICCHVGYKNISHITEEKQKIAMIPSDRESVETEEVQPKIRGLSVCKAMPFFIKHSGKEVCRRLCYFVISLLSCFLAIFVALIANTVIGHAPLLFLKIAEISEGEVDIRFAPSYEGMGYMRYLNMTRIDELTGPKIGFLAPRMEFEDARLSVQGSTKRPANLNLLLLDSAREKQQRIGSRYDAPKLGEGDCAIPQRIADYLGLKIGDKAELGIWMSSYVGTLDAIYKHRKGLPVAVAPAVPEKPVNVGEGFAPNEEGKRPERVGDQVKISCRVVSTFDSLGGKVPVGSDEEYMWMEMSTFLRHLSKEINSPDQKFKEFMATFNPFEIASKALRNHPSREEVYVDSDFQNVKKEMADQASEILDALGFYPVTSSMPILQSLLLLSMGAVFLKIVLNLVVILLAVISAFLIYSLLMISVETRMFENGLLRMMGTTKYGLAFLVIVQALIFVVPAFVSAVVLAFPTLSILSSLFESALGFTFTPVPTGTSFVWAIGIGIVVPMLASILPIRATVQQNLIQSLDTAHSKTQGVHITIEYAQRGTSWGLIAFGVVAIIYGLSINYFLPLALLSMNLQLMLWIMLIILLAIIVGLIIISLNVIHLLERLLIWACLFYESAAMKILVLKNMIAHKFRNRRTGIIYSLSLGFLLFAVVAYTMELKNTQLTMLAKHGSYLDIQWKWDNIYYRDAISLEETLFSFHNEVEDFTWASESITSQPRLKIRDTWASDFGRQTTYVLRLQSVSPNYFEVANDYFLSVFASNETTGLPLGEELYTPRGSQAMGSGSFLEEELDMEVSDPKSTYLFIVERLSTDLAYESRPLFLLNTCPGFRMSRAIKSYQSALVSIPLLVKLTGATSHTLMLYNTLSIKLKDDSIKTYDKVYTELNRMSLQRGRPFIVWSYSNASGNIDQIKFFLDIMFIVIIIFFMFLSFFSLTSSMTANILEQAKELSVVRAVGFSRNRSVLMHVYEAFILVLSSSLIGAFIGMLVGYTLSLQRALYTDLPIAFAFPYKHMLAMFATSALCAVLSTVSPSLYLLKRPIAELVKS